jgi:hypothetical protein
MCAPKGMGVSNVLACGQHMSANYLNLKLINHPKKTKLPSIVLELIKKTYVERLKYP